MLKLHVRITKNHNVMESLSKTSLNLAFLHILLHHYACNKNDSGPWIHRYLPNVYYLGVLDHYLPKLVARKGLQIDDVHVTIYSESRKECDDFIARNYTLKIGGNLTDIWRDFVDADVLITARSCFLLIFSSR